MAHAFIACEVPTSLCIFVLEHLYDIPHCAVEGCGRGPSDGIHSVPKDAPVVEIPVGVAA